MLEFCFDGLKIFLQQDMQPSNFQVHLHEMIRVEIFAGCAQLSASLKQAGFSILPIDHQKGKTLKAKLMMLDLTKQGDVVQHPCNGEHCLLPLRSSLWNWIQGPRDTITTWDGTLSCGTSA
jgi:hypothetical protein